MSSASKEDQSQQLAVNESAFLLTWLGLGVIILVEGVGLAAAGTSLWLLLTLLLLKQLFLVLFVLK